MTAKTLSDLDSFWQFLFVTVEPLIKHHNTNDVGLAELLVVRADDCIGAVLREVSEQSGVGANQTRHNLIALIEEVQLKREL